MGFFGNAGRAIRSFGSTLGKTIHNFSKQGGSFLENALKMGERAEGILRSAKEVPFLAPVRGLIEKGESALSSIRKGAEVARGVSKSLELGTGALLEPEKFMGGRVAGVRHLVEAGRQTKSGLMDLRRILGR